MKSSGFAPTGNWPSYSEEEQNAAQRILQSGRVNYWTGIEGREFEKEYAEYLGVAHAVAVMNGTVALELCLRSLGIGAGDEVIVTPRSFIASASVILQVGATPVFADIDPTSQNLDPESAEKVITPRTRAIILVHLAGWPCDIDKFQSIANKYGVDLIEDCAQAHGARYKGQAVGTFGSMAAFSFCQDKIISTAGEGGMVVTNDEGLWKSAWSYKDHGKNPDKIVRIPSAGTEFRWLHDSIGSNWRMTEIQAAIGRIQLRQLEDNITRRQEIAEKYDQSFSETAGLICNSPQNTADIRHAHYVYYLQVDPESIASGWTRNRILEEACEQGQQFRSGACPEIYQEKAFQSVRENPQCKTAKLVGERAIMIPCHHHLKWQQVESIVSVLQNIMSQAVKT